jgi:hypothetical protein
MLQTKSRDKDHSSVAGAFEMFPCCSMELNLKVVVGTAGIVDSLGHYPLPQLPPLPHSLIIIRIVLFEMNSAAELRQFSTRRPLASTAVTGCPPTPRQFIWQFIGS